MAKKVSITKVLSCFVVIVFLMSSLSVAVIASDSSNSTASNVTDNANSSVESVALSNNITGLTCRDDLIYINKTETVVNESGNSDLPVINDTDISTAKTVSSLGYCSYVWIEITDKYCKGYEVYVDGVYQFTEGESGTPDGYCRFKVTPGYHTFKLTLNGKEVSKGWNCQCGTGYNWMSMNDMRPHWCEGGGNDNPTDEYEVKFRGTVTSTTPSEYDCGFKDVYICEVKIEKVVSGDYFEKGDIVNIVYSQCRENAHVCGTYDKVSVGDTVEVYGETIPIFCVGTWITICGKNSYYLKQISSESLSISVWTDKSEYKIGETVTINYQTNKKCTAKLTITKPDGSDVVYGPNEIPASTRSKSATAGYPTGKRTVVFEAWAGSEYKKATCYFEVVEEAKKVKIRGEILVDSPIISFYSFDIKIDEILEDPTGNLLKGETVNVYGHRSGPAQVDDVIVGDEVDVFGDYQGYVEGATFERIFLSDWGESSSDHYVKIIEPTVWNVKFEGVISKIFNKESSNWYDAEIKVTKVIDDPSETLYVNKIATVYRANENAYEDAVSVGDLVEVCAEYNSKYEDSRYALRDWQHHIKKMEVKTPVHNIDTGKDFSSIQAAINDSDTSPGNTITVDPGTYTENVDVTKSLTIKSTSGNPEDTIVQAAVSNQNYQNVFTVTSDNVHIDGFTIKGASYFWCSGILLDSNNCIISNNTFEGNAIGIWIHPPSLGNNVIRNNKFSSSSGYSPSTALYLEAANNKIYLNNFIIGIEGSDYPGNFWNSPSKTTYTYKGNTFTNYLGNYWEEYTDTDADSDGIWDHPYSIDEDKDNYPLVWRFENYVSVEEKPEIEFIGIFDHSLSMWNGNAQGYFFSIHAAPVRQVVTCGQACIVIPLNTPDKKLAAISLFLKTLKKGDMVSIYAELKSEGTFCDLGFTSDKYFVRRYSTDLEKEYTKFLSDIDSFYFHYSINALGHASWEGKSYDEKMEAIKELEDLVIKSLIEKPALDLICYILPSKAGILLTLISTVPPWGLEIVKLSFHIEYMALFKDIAETLKASDAVTLQNRLLSLAGNGDQLKEKLEQEEDTTSLLETRRDKIIKAYKTQSTLDQQFFDYLQGSTYSFKITDYQMLFGLTVTLNTKLEQDFAFTTALLNSYTNKNQEVELQKAAECSLNSHIMTAFDGTTYCFGYLHSTKETDTYTVQLTKEGYFGIKPNPDGPGLIFILKKDGIQCRGGESKEGVRVYIPSGVYKLEVSSWSDAPTGYIFCPYGDNIQISCN